MRVLISGAGVGGLTLAYWLRRWGVGTPVIVERAAEPRSGQFGIDFFGTAHDVATRMGLAEQIAAAQLPIEAVVFVNGSGRHTARIDRHLLETAVRGPHTPILHGSLERILLEAVSADVEIRRDRTIVAAEPGPRAVRVTFSDGVEEEFDVLVGADGVHSTVRRLVFGPDHGYVRPIGYHIASYSVPDRYDLGPIRAHFGEPGRQISVYRTGQPGGMNVVFVFRHRGEAIGRRERLALLRRQFAGMGWIVPRILADAPEPDEIFMDAMVQVVLPAWHRPRTALIGDAAGAMTPFSAQGVSMAMAGGYLLAEALRECSDHPAGSGQGPDRCLARYSARLHPEVTRRQEQARAFAPTLVPSTRLELAAQLMITRVLPRGAMISMLRRRFGAGSVLGAEPSDVLS